MAKDQAIEQMRKKYLREKGTSCPYCGGEIAYSDEDGKPISLGENLTINIPVHCVELECGRQWVEVAKLVDVKLEPPRCDNCSGQNTAFKCKTCGMWLCQDCEEMHICEAETA